MTNATETTRTIQTKVGVVDRASTDKTRRVVINFQAKHPKYGKYMKRQTHLFVHDEGNVSGLGDRVLIMPCRPMSKTKRWKVVNVIDRAAADD